MSNFKEELVGSHMNIALFEYDHETSNILSDIQILSDIDHDWMYLVVLSCS